MRALNEYGVLLEGILVRGLGWWCGVVWVVRWGGSAVWWGDLVVVWCFGVVVVVVWRFCGLVLGSSF